ncbi:MAG TPA: Gmad2 immunoglobulin-like domain-containing protein [Candidatus Saccharimonadales bacterium]|nr:Gmad2 immunoglobulin-like domain-containing protein [Candidatus Saccharimonadales bacterium]
MKKEQFLLIIVAMILVSAIFLRVVQIRNQHKVGVTSLPVVEVSKLTPVESVATSTVVISQPLPGEAINSPLEINGQAPGNWFFEATLPVKLVSVNGEIIVAHYAEAQSDWMVTDLVPFKATLEFSTTATSGYLVISKDNPSGLPENDASFKIPVNF